MGRIKSIMVKRAARQLLERENSFSSDFTRNKRLLNDTMPSKPIRNRIAGYMARLLKTNSLKINTK